MTLLIKRNFIFLERIIIGTLVIGYGTYILNANFPIAGKAAYEYNGGAFHGILGRLRPGDRVEYDGAKPQPGTVRIIENPVYFDAHTSLSFRSARLELVYRSTLPYSVALGVKNHQRGSSLSIEKGSEGVDSAGWRHLSTTLPLPPRDALDSGYTFVVSIPGITHGAPVEVQKIRVSLERDPLSWRDIGRVAQKIVTKIFR